MIGKAIIPYYADILNMQKLLMITLSHKGKKKARKEKIYIPRKNSSREIP